MAGGSRKVIGFDLDTKALQKYYPGTSWRKSYEDIKKFMTSNNFEWKQGSIYVSQKPLKYYVVYNIVDSLIEKHPWLNACMRDCIMADIGKRHSLNTLFDKEGYLSEPKERANTIERTFARRR